MPRSKFFPINLQRCFAHWPLRSIQKNLQRNFYFWSFFPLTLFGYLLEIKASHCIQKSFFSEKEIFSTMNSRQSQFSWKATSRIQIWTMKTRKKRYDLNYFQRFWNDLIAKLFSIVEIVRLSLKNKHDRISQFVKSF